MHLHDFHAEIPHNFLLAGRPIDSQQRIIIASAASVVLTVFAAVIFGIPISAAAIAAIAATAVVCLRFGGLRSALFDVPRNVLFVLFDVRFIADVEKLEDVKDSLLPILPARFASEFLPASERQSRALSNL